MDIAELATTGGDIMVTKYYYLGATTILFYDLLLTLPDQITFVWKSKMNFASYLFLFNCYFPCACCIIVNVAFFLPQFTPEICDKWVFMQYIQIAVVTLVSQIFMTYRVYAMSGRNKPILYSFSILSVTQGIFVLALLSIPGNKGMTVPDIPLEAYHLCNVDPPSKIGDMAYLVLSLAFDLSIFILTLHYTLKASRASKGSHLAHAVLQDGTVYFFYIFAANIVWLICILTARPVIKYIQGGPNLLMTPLLIGRMTLSLYKANRRDRGLFNPNLPRNSIESCVEDYQLSTFLPYNTRSSI